MTPLETWITTYWWQLGLLVIFAVGITVRFRRSEKDLEAHLSPNNPSPHVNCAVHNTLLTEIRDDVKSIKEHFYRGTTQL